MECGKMLGDSRQRNDRIYLMFQENVLAVGWRKDWMGQVEIGHEIRSGETRFRGCCH